MTTAPPPTRATVLAELTARALRARSTLLVAPPGFGRTRALHAAADAAEHAGRRVERVQATAEDAAPLALFLGLLDAATSRRLAASDPFARTAAVRAAVLDLQLDLLVVDDGSRLEPASAALLLDLAVGGPAVVVGLTAGRPVPEALRALEALPGTETLVLPPLDRAGVAEVAVAHLRGPVDSGLAAALATAAAGSPATLRELLREGRTSGAVARSGELWRLAGPLPPPAAVRRAAGERFPGLSPAVQAWAGAVALAGPIADDLADALVLDDVADTAELDGWTVHEDGGTVMRSTALAAAVVPLLGSRRRRATVRRILAAMRELPRQLTLRELAQQAAWRVDLGEAMAAEEALALAAEVSGHAPEVAERMLRRAASGGDSAARLALAEHLALAGRDAAGLLERTGGSGTATRLRAGVDGYLAGRPVEALAALEAEGDPADPSTAAMRAGLLRSAGRTTESLAAARALAHGPSGAGTALAAVHEALALIDLGEADEAEAVVARLGADPAALDGVPGGAATARWLALRIAVEVRLGTATASVAEAHEAALAEPTGEARAPFAHLLGRVLLLRGEPAAAVAPLREAVTAPGLWSRTRMPVLLADLASAQALSGSPDAADALLAGATAGALAPAQAVRVALAASAVAVARGRRARAAAIAAEAAADAARLDRVVDRVDASYDGVLVGDRRAAERLLAGPRLPGPGRALQVRHAAALVAGDAAELAATAAALRAEGLVLFAIGAAAAGVDTGEGDLAVAGRLTAWAAQAPQLAVPLSARGRSDGLTARETEVARLAAAGLPDRAVAAELGISLRTAQTHLGRVFAKLGVHRRSQLRDLLADPSAG